MKTLRASKGFSLVELMVAMVAGLIVIGAVVLFTISTARSSSVNVRSIRLMQELRNSLNLIEREIRRSGFDESALSYIGACVDPATNCPLTNYKQVVIANSSCLVVSYDNASNTTPGTAGAGEYHGFRLQQNSSGVGVIQASLSSATAPDCSATDNTWQDITDAGVVNVTNLNFTQSAANGGCIKSSVGIWVVVQDVLVQMTGQWAEPAGGVVTTRTLEETVRVRNDLVSTTKPATCP